MDGNLNDDHCVHLRAMAAANNIARRRGWVQAEDVGERNRQEIANIVDVQRTVLLLFAGYMDAATQMSESCGGGGSIPDGWGRDKDEDDLAWARRCARMANRMCKAPVYKGLKR